MSLFLGTSQRWLAVLLYLAYVVVQYVILLNLLIAIMGDSHDRVQVGSHRTAYTCPPAR